MLVHFRDCWVQDNSESYCSATARRVFPVGGASVGSGDVKRSRLE